MDKENPAPLQGMRVTEYKRILDSGMFWVLYPDATGNYNVDCEGLSIKSNDKPSCEGLVDEGSLPCSDDYPVESCEDEQVYSTPYQPRLAPETNKYTRNIKGVLADVYDVLVAFEIHNPALAHAIKKMLVPGKRGSKDFNTDVDEAIESLHRAKELQR